MNVVRRAYLYIVCLIALEAVTWATVTLLRRLIVLGPAAGANQITLQLAIIFVGLPFFLVHWRWAEQDARRSVDERASAIRRVYLYGSIALLLVPSIANVYDLLNMLLGRALGESLAGAGGAAGASPRDQAIRAAVGVIVLGIVALYQALVVRGDRAAAGERGPSAMVRRVFVLGFSAMGAILILMSTYKILRLGLRGVNANELITIGHRGLIAASLAGLLIGLAVWVPFWSWAGRLVRGPDPTERASALRQLYLYGFVFAGVVGTVTGAGLILAGVLRGALGLPAAGDLAVPLAAIAVLGGSWAYHYRVLRADIATMPDTPGQAAVRRLYLYLVAAVGLAAFLMGAAGLLQTVIRTLLEQGAAAIPAGSLETTAAGAVLKERLARFTALAVAGAPVWLVAWRRAQAAAEADGVTGERERASIVRKFYLYGYLVATTLVTLAGTVYVVYRLLDRLVGATITDRLGGEMAESVAYTLIGVAVWLFHGQAVRSDARRTATDRAGRLAALRTVVVEAGWGDLTQVLVGALHRSLPDLPVEVVDLRPEREAGTGQARAAQPPDAGPVGGEAVHYAAADIGERLAAADLVIAPWPPAPGAETDDNAASFATVFAKLTRSPARKLLLPHDAPGWHWAGVEATSPDDQARDVARSVQHLVDGGADEWRPLGAWHTAGIVIAAIVVTVVMFNLIAPVLQYLFEG